MLPKISIVTPSYNQGMFLERTIRSVLDQGYPNLQYVIIDGGSTDDSVEIIRRYQDKLHYWVSEPDSGHADAINKGFSQCDGEIMAWLNSDDMYLCKSLHVVGEIFQSLPDAQWITGLCSFWDADDRLVHSYRSLKNLIDFAAGDPRWIQQESTFWRRSLWEKAGGQLDESYRYMIDNDLWSRFFPHAELYHVQTVLSGYRYHGANRAFVNRDACDRELERAQSELIGRLDESTLRTVARHSRNLSWYRKLAHMGRPLSLLPNILSRTIFRGDQLKYYPIISYSIEHGHWQKNIIGSFD